MTAPVYETPPEGTVCVQRFCTHKAKYLVPVEGREVRHALCGTHKNTQERDNKWERARNERRAKHEAEETAEGVAVNYATMLNVHLDLFSTDGKGTVTVTDPGKLLAYLERS